MIFLLGASGYIGEAFANELQRRKTDFIPLSRKQVDYTRFDVLLDFLQTRKPEFVINAAGYTGKPNVDACELDKAGTLAGNTLLPQTIAGARFQRVHFQRRKSDGERADARGKGHDEAGIARVGGKIAGENPRLHGSRHAEFFLP
jgi:hypothetical protein